MFCERYLNAINELIDGTLGPLRRAELQLHLESCEDCARLVEDLREIARAAEALEDLKPPARVWARIEERLLEDERVAAPARAWAGRPSYTLVALAAALVLAIGASLLLLIPRQRPTTASTAPAATAAPQPSGNVPAGDSVQAVTSGVATEWALTEKHFQNLIEEAKKPGSAVAPETVAVLQQNYMIMTDAMEKSSKVLVTDPQNVVARDSFYELLRQKIRFLQDTIALMNEMRQGDAAGAAELVESGKS